MIISHLLFLFPFTIPLSIADNSCCFTCSWSAWRPGERSLPLWWCLPRSQEAEGWPHTRGTSCPPCERAHANHTRTDNEPGVSKRWKAEERLSIVPSVITSSTEVLTCALWGSSRWWRLRSCCRPSCCRHSWWRTGSDRRETLKTLTRKQKIENDRFH